MTLLLLSACTWTRHTLGLSWHVSDWRDWTRQSDLALSGQDFYFSCPLYFFSHYSPLLTFFFCFIVLFQCCCFHAQDPGVSLLRKTLVHEFPIFYSHTQSEWNLLYSGTNTVVWWRACYKITKLQSTKWAWPGALGLGLDAQNYLRHLSEQLLP